jgi:hypothetical protein
MNELSIAAIRAILRRKDGWKNKEILINDWLDGCEFANKQEAERQAMYDKKMKLINGRA